ncbi:MAG: transporter substrate-binding domain-containing protein [Methylocystaceae bacterium]|nr:transporter substrate-binding domain-containing protein [Methylocystaceae bacterium]
MRLRTIIICFASYLSCLLPQASADGSVILLGYGPHFGVPYTIMVDGKLSGGWVVDTAKALEQKINKTVITIPVARKRQTSYLNNAKIDVYCFSNPAWSEKSEVIKWTQKLFSVQNVIISKKEISPTLKNAEDLKGFRIGTILGYSYQTIDYLFEQNLAIRHDITSAKQNFRMLKAGRVDAIIASRSTALDIMASLDMSEEFSIAPFIVEERDLHCALSTRSQTSVDILSKAFAQMIQEGFFKRPKM